MCRPSFAILRASPHVCLKLQCGLGQGCFGWGAQCLTAFWFAIQAGGGGGGMGGVASFAGQGTVAKANNPRADMNMAMELKRQCQVGIERASRVWVAFVWMLRWSVVMLDSLRR
jgi:hypothetical protein